MKFETYLRLGWSGVLALGLCGIAVADDNAPEFETGGGAIDGIYQCRVLVSGTTHDTYLTLNGKRDGKSIYLIAAHTPDRQAIGGWGVGRVNGEQFVGSTSAGKKFSFTVGLGSSDTDSAYETVTLKGKAGVKTLAGLLVNADLDCTRLW